MDYIIHMYDSNQYESYELAAPDGATYSTDSAITLESATAILDITEVLQSAMGCIGYALDSVRLGILKQGTFVPLQDVIAILDSDRTSVVIHAIDFAYAALVDVTITFNRGEVKELEFRMNKMSRVFRNEHDPAMDITAIQETELWRKLRDS